MNTKPLIEHNQIMVKEKVTIFSNKYTLYDIEGNTIGLIKENRSLWKYLIKRFFSPFRLTCYDNNNQVVAKMKKGWALFRPTYIMYDDEGHTTGSIKSKFTLIKEKARMLDANGKQVGFLEGNWLSWDFSIRGENGESLAHISKQFNGVMKEIFTTADKYLVEINPEVTDKALRTTIIMSACAVDMILKEG